MDKISDHTTKTDVEMYTYDHFDKHRKPCVHLEKINSVNSKKIINFLKAYTKSEIKLYEKNNFGKNMFNLFSNVLILMENEDKIDCEIIDKNSTSIQKIVDLKKKSSYKSCIVFARRLFQIILKNAQHPLGVLKMRPRHDGLTPYVWSELNHRVICDHRA